MCFMGCEEINYSKAEINLNVIDLVMIFGYFFMTFFH